MMHDKNQQLPESLTLTQVSKLMDSISISEQEPGYLHTLYNSNGLEIAMRTHFLATNQPIAILYIIDGDEQTRIPGTYQEGLHQTNLFLSRSLVKTWYQHVAAKACAL